MISVTLTGSAWKKVMRLAENRLVAVVEYEVGPEPPDDTLYEIQLNSQEYRDVMDILFNRKPGYSGRQPEDCGVDDRQVGGTHYKDMGIEPWNVIDTWPYGQRIGAYRAGILKYAMRMGAKDNAIEDAEKCLHYAEKLVDTLKRM